jgi:peptidoglycan DL-endopeptidase CwlO
MNNQSSATGETAGAAAAGQSSTATGTTPASTTPPVTNQTPANTVGSGTASGQTTTPGATTSNNDQNAGSNSVRHISDLDNTNQKATGSASANEQSSASDNAGQKLPQTASPLPLLGLLGLGSLVTGFVTRRRK